ncbi:yippee-domain-containing protein [Hypoxylon sp. FL1284]|nr:yippee-domain-containing protein [Hypoxylon sp. FL1284]
MYSIMFSDMLPALPPLPPPPAEASHPAPKFPVYLLPTLAIPFRRRRQSPSAGSSGSPADTPPSLSASPTDSALSSPVGSPNTPTFSLPKSILPNFRSKDKHSRGSGKRTETTKLAQTQPDTIRCSTCASDLAFTSQIVSKGFTGRYGRALLVQPPDQAPRKGSKAKELINIKIGREETRLLVTGSHVVADISCAICNSKLGWKYIDAKEEAQKYKIGKFILEIQRTVTYRNWEDVAVDEMPELEMERKYIGADNDDEPVIFDSDDEDECEDLFSGTWDPEIVAKRRGRKVNQRQKKKKKGE